MDNEIIQFSIPELSFHTRTISMREGIHYRDSHQHNAIELICVEGSPICCYIGEKTLTIHPGQVVLINAQTVHRLQAIAQGKLTYIQIDISKYDTPAYSGSFIGEFVVRTQARSYGVFDSPHEMVHIFHRMKQEVENKKSAYSNFVRACIFHLVAIMHREGFIVPVPSAMAETLDRIFPVISYIESHYPDKLTLEDLGRQIGCDKYRLCHLFKKGTGGSVVDYCNFVRLQKAESLLKNSTQNISEVALSCGFASVQYFNRVFKQHRGCSPSTYKRQCNQV